MASRAITIEILGDASGAKKAFAEAESASDGFGSKVGSVLGGLGKVAAIGGAAIGGLAVAVGKQAVDAFQQAERASAQTQAVIQSTGGAANVTADHVDDLAKSMAMTAGVMNKETVKAGENLLLTFTAVRNQAGEGNDVFDQATKTMTNMAIALGEDAPTAAMQLGKALNDPVRGITALRRVGVAFTNEQEDQIKAMVAAGDTMGAQKAVLAELNKEFGGSAEAAGHTMAGALGRLHNVWNELLVQVGEKFAPVIVNVADWLGKNLPNALETASRWWDTLSAAVSPVMDVVGKIAGQFRNLFDVFSSGDDVAQGAGEVIDNMLGNTGQAVGPVRALVESFGDAKTAVGDFVSGFTGGADLVGKKTSTFEGIGLTVRQVFEQIGSVLEVVGATIVGWVNTHQATIQQWVAAIGQIVGTLSDIFHAAFDAVVGVVSVAINIITDLWARFGSGLVEHIGTAIGLVLDVISNVFEVIRGAFNVFAGIFTGDWERVWDGIKGIFAGAWGIIGDIIRFAMNALSEAIGAGMAVISALWSFAWHALHTALEAAWRNISGAVASGIEDVLNWLRGLPGRVLGALGDLGQLLWDKGRDIVTGLWNGIASMGDWLRGQLVGWVRDHLPGPVADILGAHSPSTLFAQLGATIPQGLAQGILSGADLVERAVATMTPTGADMPGMGLAGAGLGPVSFGSGAVVVNIYGDASEDDVRGGVTQALNEFVRELRAS